MYTIRNSSFLSFTHRIKSYTAMKHFTILFMIAIFIFTACSSGKKAYQKGNYEEAIYAAIKRLRKSPENEKAIEAIQSAYPALQNYYQEKINVAKLSSNPLRWEKVMAHYKELNHIYNEIQRSPGARRVLVGVQNYSNEYEEAVRNAAEARYALGNQELEKNLREAAKVAYKHFQKCLDLRPNFRDAEDKLYQARDMATIVVQIDPIPMHSRALELSNEFFENQITEFVRSNTWSPFVQFYSAKQTNARHREPDHILVMKFDEFVVGQAYIKEKEAERLKDSVVTGTVKINEDSTANAYGTVKATVHQFTKEISSSGLLDVKIIDARTNAVVSQQKFPGTFIWVDHWGYFNGDERALDKGDKKFLKKKREIPSPPPQDLFIEFTKPIFNQVTDFVTDYYRNY